VQDSRDNRIILSRKSYKRLLRRISQQTERRWQWMVRRDRQPDMLSQQFFKPKIAKWAAL